MRKLLNVAMVTASAGAMFYTYVSYRANSNLSSYVKQLKNRQRPNPQPNAQYPRATLQENEEIKSKLKTGDIVFFRYNYQEALSTSQYLRGLFDSLFKLRQELNSVGYVYKTDKETYVLYNQLGETKVRRYQQFADLPFLTLLVFQEASQKIDFQGRLKDLLQKEPGKVTIELRKETPAEMANRVNRHLFEKDYNFIIDVMEMRKNKDKGIKVNTRLDRLGTLNRAT